MFSLFVSSGSQQTEDNGPLRIYHQLELQITLESPRQNTPQGEHKEELFYFMWILTLKVPFPPGKIFCIFFFLCFNLTTLLLLWEIQFYELNSN